MRAHFEEYRPVYVAGAVGFLCGGFVVLAFSRRAQVVVKVDSRRIYMAYDER